MDKLANGTRICVFGAAPDTSNLGVSALYLSIMNGIAIRDPEAQVTVFDHGIGLRRDEVLLENGSFSFTRIGAKHSRRIYRRDSLFNMRASAALGGLGNPGIMAIDAADAVFDISGGDSFADLYGPKRFASMTQSKRLVLDRGTPLFLLPQTYGPYSEPRTWDVARRIVQESAMAWARDERSFETLTGLLGDVFDAERHRSGVDVAFALPRIEARDVPDWFQDWTKPDRTRPVIGFNVSGLIYMHAERSGQFGFLDDYREIVHCCVRRLLDGSDGNVVLISHVLAQPGHYESDPDACHAVAKTLGFGDRLRVLDRRYNAMEMKWAIGQLDFMCGTRMHSTIAGLSSGVPTTSLAYSRKTLGVFETCGQGDHVADPRRRRSEECAEIIWNAWTQRDQIKLSLEAVLPTVLKQANDQFDRLFDCVRMQRSQPDEVGAAAVS